ncbi:MAG: serine/threonine protein kinase [Candidatus Cryptobacteroides sp.]
MILQGEAEKQKHLYYEFDRSQEPVGIGGMGVVYRGRMVDELTGAFRDVAIKEVQPEGDETERALVLNRARREASIQIRHDNLIEMLGFVEVDEKKLGTVKKRLYIVSEFLEGVTLDKVLAGVYTDYRGDEIHFAKDLSTRYSANPEETATYIIKNVLSAIVALHDNGFLHRDIDPSNIMITEDGKIKLIDFGIAKKQDALSSNDKMQSDEGSFVGKAEYAAPELISGKVSAQDFTTDIYSIGVLFYKLLTGTLPFEGNRFDIIKGQLNGKPDLRKIKSAKYRVIVGKAMSKEQSKRYSSASMMRADLDGLAPAPAWSKIAISVLASLLVVLVTVILIRVLLKHTTDTTDTTDTTGIVEQKDLTDILGKPMPEIWKILANEPFNSGALYMASLDCEKHLPDKYGIDFWNDNRVKQEIKKYFKVDNPKISTKRLSYVLACMAYDSANKSKGYDSEFKLKLAERVKQLQLEFPELYILPEGL